MAYFTPEELPENKYYILEKKAQEIFQKILMLPFLEKCR
jgi:cation transport regulator ChaB